MKLYELGKRKRFRLGNIPTHGLLNSIGVREGKRASVVTRQPLGGPIVIEIDRRSIAIAKDIACQIEVEEE